MTMVMHSVSVGYMSSTVALAVVGVPLGGMLLYTISSDDAAVHRYLPVMLGVMCGHLCVYSLSSH